MLSMLLLVLAPAFAQDVSTVEAADATLETSVAEEEVIVVEDVAQLAIDLLKIACTDLPNDEDYEACLDEVAVLEALLAARPPRRKLRPTGFVLDLSGPGDP